MLLLCFAASTVVLAQPNLPYTTKKTVAPDVKKQFDEAMRYNIAGNTEKALKGFSDAVKADGRFIDAQIQVAAMHQELRHWAEAEREYLKALAIDSSYEPRVWYALATTEKNQQKYVLAAQHYQRCADAPKTHVDLRPKAIRNAEDCRLQDQAVHHHVPFNPVSLGAGVNTVQMEYLPSLTADGNTLVFTRLVDRQEDFYMSRKVDSVWQTATPITSINTDESEGAQCISADGKLLFFTACNRPNGLGSCDLFFSEYKNGTWTPPINAGEPLNTRAWEGQPSLSADGRALYFASDRAGGVGAKDLYVSLRLPNGNWGTPQNLGKNINTTADDQAPFIHPDNQTLYFTSDGLPSMGSRDLYFVRRDTSGAWGVPQNLGYPINTAASEATLVVSLDGKTAYYTRNEGGNNDLYRFELYAAARPKPVTYVRARIRDAQTGQPLTQCRVVFSDLVRNATYTEANTGDDSTFLVCLPVGKNYALNVDKKGYAFRSENFDLSNAADSFSFEKPFVLIVSLAPLDGATTSSKPNNSSVTPSVDKPIALNNVFFESKSAKLRRESTTELLKLQQLLELYPTMRIQIQGHTDNIGSDADNQILSEKRAQAVMAFLTEHGIAPDRLQAKGFGKTQAIDTNDTDAGRAKNRRTEFVILQR